MTSMNIRSRYNTIVAPSDKTLVFSIQEALKDGRTGHGVIIHQLSQQQNRTRTLAVWTRRVAHRRAFHMPSIAVLTSYPGMGENNPNSIVPVRNPP
jgi:hypothetical protein